MELRSTAENSLGKSEFYLATINYWTNKKINKYNNSKCTFNFPAVLLKGFWQRDFEPLTTPMAEAKLPRISVLRENSLLVRGNVNGMAMRPRVPFYSCFL